MGWINRRRDHGNLIFLDLRDRTGISQMVLDAELAPQVPLPRPAPRSHAALRNIELRHKYRTRCRPSATTSTRSTSTRASSRSRRRFMTRSTPEGARDYLVPAACTGRVLRAAAVAAALQADPDDLRLRPLLPDRALLPRRRPARRPPARVHADRPGDELPAGRDHLRDGRGLPRRGLRAAGNKIERRSRA
jgi:hypothetical protein